MSKLFTFFLSSSVIFSFAFFTPIHAMKRKLSSNTEPIDTTQPLDNDEEEIHKNYLNDLMRDPNTALATLATTEKNCTISNIQYLLEAKANINGQHLASQETTLIHAVDLNKIDVVQYLISQNADLEMAIAGEQTALWCAARNTNEKTKNVLTSLLIAAGAELAALDTFSSTSRANCDFVIHATNKHHQAMLNELKQNIASLQDILPLLQIILSYACPKFKVSEDLMPRFPICTGSTLNVIREHIKATEENSQKQLSALKILQ